MKRLPFGVKPAAAIFQKTMENLLQGIPFVVVYQDDITVSGKDMNEHIRNLKSVLNKLLQAGLKLNLSKCKFFKEEISYLGFTIDRFGLRKNKERINSVLNAPIPNNVSELRAFIGLVNYYAKFVNNFAKIMTPLYKLLQKNVRFEWSESCQIAYDTIRKEITSEKVLVHFNPKLPIFLTTDASDYAIAGVLSHKFSENEFKPVAFISRALSKTEQKYSTHEKEALAIIFSVTKLKQYLIGNVFTLGTDHKPLISIFGQNKGLPVMAAARVQRWAFILSGFNYKIEYVKGQLNEADNLSRIPQFKTNVVNENDINDSTFINYIQKDNMLSLDFKDIARENRRDPILSKVCEFVRMGKIRELTGDEFKSFINKDIELTVDHDSPGHPATNGQAENFVKSLKKSIYANLNSEKKENIDVILNRFLMDYRNTKHSSTGESPAKIFIGRSIRTRLDLIKPPLFKNKMLENQMKSISNHKGNRSVTFEKGQNVFIRDYTNVNKESWAPAIIKDRTGSLSYQCILSTGRVIKRHTDQIRAGVKDVSNDFIPPELPSSSNGSTSTEKVERSHNDNNSSEVNNNEHEPNSEIVNESINTNVNEELSNKNQTEKNENKCGRVLRPRTNKKI
ncbi:uncharacterized protein K02A2.6-like [Lucilia sericata]|uniref:uncharacterized protein K02A2.6-like n=1 Tax=Lucilia sericata TaxID=13632 RepID=UPI0018A7FEA6|nr:uncharacterized protein K02A2.6-like [Lucilia sericata]